MATETQTRLVASGNTYSGPELLGLVTLWECLGDDWNQQQPDVLGELFERMDE